MASPRCKDKKNMDIMSSDQDEQVRQAIEIFRARYDAVEPLMRTTCHGLNNHLTRLLMHTEMINMLMANTLPPKVAERLKAMQD